MWHQGANPAISQRSWKIHWHKIPKGERGAVWKRKIPRQVLDLSPDDTSTPCGRSFIEVHAEKASHGAPWYRLQMTRRIIKTRIIWKLFRGGLQHPSDSVYVTCSHAFSFYKKLNCDSNHKFLLMDSSNPREVFVQSFMRNSRLSVCTWHSFAGS